MNSPKVVIVLVTYNAAAYIEKSLESIRMQRYPENFFQAILVDNASTDDTVRIVQERFPWVTVIAEATNHGFAKGNNLAMRRFDADYFALVNPDVVLHPDWLESIINVMETDQTIGIAGSKLYYGNRVLLQHAGGVIQDNALTKHIGSHELDIGQYNTLCEVDYVIGAALVARGSVMRELNYFSEDYFMYFEDADLCVRAQRVGHRVVFVPQAIGYHDEKYSTSGTESRKYLLMYHRARYLFALRNFNTIQERKRFQLMERHWKRNYIYSIRYRWLLFFSKLTHWRLLKTNIWLLLT